MSLPQWLVDKLREENPDGMGRGAQLGTCDQCGAPVLRGLDGDIAAAVAVTTPIELDRYGEYLALARGCRTYHLAHRFGASGRPRWEIDPRDRWHIENPRRRYAVIPAHRCGMWHPTATDGLLTKQAAPVDFDTPPF